MWVSDDRQELGGRGNTPKRQGRGYQKRGCVVLLFGVVLGVGLSLVPTRWQQRLLAEDAKPRPVSERGALPPDEQAQVDVFDRVGPSVVYITNMALVRRRFSLDVFQIPKGTGTGFVWDEDGHVVTNYHVIEGANQILVTLDGGERLPAKVVGVAPRKELAVLRIDTGGKVLRPVSVGRSANLKVGQRVYAIGNPFGFDHTMTSGIVSALGRELKASNGRTLEGLIQTDAAINPGNSGGPLIDSAGRVIGVNTAIYSKTGAYAGIGFAVPIDELNDVVPKLIAHGKLLRPTLGIRIAPEHLTRRARIAGVLVWDVVAGSSAERAGLRPTREARGRLVLGDVIIAIGGNAVRSGEDLLGLLESRKPGEVLDVTLQRGNKRVVVKVTLGAAQ